MARKRVKIEGFSRVAILKNGEMVGDSGLTGPNQVTNLGFLDYLVFLLGASAGSSQVGFVALGTGAAPASNATTLPGEIMASTQRKAVTFGSVASTTAQFTATFSSSNSFVTATYNISNIGLFALTTTANQIFCGNTYASSQLNTNQDCQITYQIRFSAS